MTFKDALLYIQINGEYHKDGKITFKLKVSPANHLDFIKYHTDVLVKKLVVTNKDAKKYTNEDNFIVIPFDIDTLAEETHHI